MQVRCDAARRRPRYPDERCNGFVAEVPGTVISVRLVAHSSDADPRHMVAACTHCRALHEIELADERAA